MHSQNEGAALPVPTDCLAFGRPFEDSSGWITGISHPLQALNQENLEGGTNLAPTGVAHEWGVAALRALHKRSGPA